MSFDLSDYVDVAERVRLFWKSFPEGSIQTDFMGLLPGRDDMFYAVTKVYRNPGDTSPVTGMAAELIQGKTSFTRNSELMNLETSSVGRALGMLGIGIKKSLASRDEVSLSEARNKGADYDRPATPPVDPWAVIDEPEAIKTNAEYGGIKTEPRFCDHGEMWRHKGHDKNGKAYVAHNCTAKVCETQWQR